MSRGARSRESVQLEVICADAPGFLANMSEQGVELRNIRNIDALTIQVECLRGDRHKIERIAVKFGAKVSVLRNPGNIFFDAWRRPALLITCLLFAISLGILPTRVFFIRVDGNITVPTNKILEEAENCGIRFGASRRQVRSERVKNALLSAVPQLQWAGINTKGCVATISIREKSLEENVRQDIGIGSIIANTDGIIQSCTVLNGTAMCRVGDAVTAGETLVSGYTDCGIILKAVRAEAEITACTIRSISAITPIPDVIRGEQIYDEIKYSLRIGKKLINFFKDSGISDTSCVKMYSEEYLTLPGGFQLPVALVSQRYIYYDSSPVWDPDWELWLADACREYLRSRMQAGQIISEDTQIQSEDVCCFYGKYTCLENIGQFVNEEIVKNDG